MSENYRRCRFYPNCLIHLGDPLPWNFSPENKQEIAELHSDGWLHQEIADAFGTHTSTVSRIVKPRSRRPFG